MEVNIKNTLELYLKRINGNKDSLPKIDEYNYDGYPFILTYPNHYEYVIQEGNTEYLRKTYYHKEELLYTVMNDIIRDIASQYELEHRNENQDFRIIWNKKRVELMSKINPKWGKRLKDELLNRQQSKID